MSLTPVGGIGSFNMHTTEPTGYMVRGSMQITNYSDLVLRKITQTNAPAKAKASTNISPKAKGHDGNSMLRGNFFSPAALILSTSVDIYVYERKPKDKNPAGAGSQGYMTELVDNPIYVIKGARFGSYSISYNVGSLVQESVSFMATEMYDSRAGETKSKVEVF
jgi:hypothetical protein